MAVKVTEVRSGIFVVLAVLVLGILIFSVGNFRQRFQTTTRFTSYLPDAKFLKSHDPVTYGGLRVGEIRAVEVSSERFGLVKVTLEVARDIPVKKDSTVILKQDGMLGAKYLEISPGSPESKPLEPGADLRGIVPPAITDLSAAMEAPLGKLDRVLASLDAILGRPENQRNIAEILDESRKLLSTMDAELKKIADVAGQTGEKTQKVLDEVQTTVREARGPLVSTLKNSDELTLRLGKSVEDLTGKVSRSLDEMTSKLSHTADGLDRLLHDADATLLANNTNLYETIRGLRDTAHHLELAAKRIRANPSILLFGANETPEERMRTDDTELQLRGRARRYDKEDPK